MKYMKLYGSIDAGESNDDVVRLRRRIERYRRALRRCARRVRRQRENGAATEEVTDFARLGLPSARTRSVGADVAPRAFRRSLICDCPAVRSDS